MSSAGLQFACATCELVWAEVGHWLFHRWDVSQRGQTSGAAVPLLVFYFWAARVECGGCCHCQRPSHPFVGFLYWPHFATIEQNRTHDCLVGPALCTLWYFHLDQRQVCMRENVKRVRFITFLNTSLPWTFATNIEPRCLNSIFDAIMRMLTATTTFCKTDSI